MQHYGDLPIATSAGVLLPSSIQGMLVDWRVTEASDHAIPLLWCILFTCDH
jgi:hypothetical protein